MSYGIVLTCTIRCTTIIAKSPFFTQKIYHRSTCKS